MTFLPVIFCSDIGFGYFSVNFVTFLKKGSRFGNHGLISTSYDEVITSRADLKGDSFGCTLYTLGLTAIVFILGKL